MVLRGDIGNVEQKQRIRRRKLKLCIPSIAIGNMTKNGQVWRSDRGKLGMQYYLFNQDTIVGTYS